MEKMKKIEILKKNIWEKNEKEWRKPIEMKIHWKRRNKKIKIHVSQFN